MNLKIVLKVVGRVLQLEAVALALPLITALIYGEDPRPFFLAMVITAALGILLAKIPARKGF